tara:strand:+ start:2284 stop:2562 length:279 start_codon:yes stop_codon:yes gene_type:complete
MGSARRQLLLDFSALRHKWGRNDGGIAGWSAVPICFVRARRAGSLQFQGSAMKIRNSLKSLKKRHRDNRVIRRRGRTYVINKTNKRMKARQG